MKEGLTVKIEVNGGIVDEKRPTITFSKIVGGTSVDQAVKPSKDCPEPARSPVVTLDYATIKMMERASEYVENYCETIEPAILGHFNMKNQGDLQALANVLIQKAAFDVAHEIRNQ